MLRVQAHGRGTATRPASAFRAIPSRNAGKLANRGTTGLRTHIARHRLQPAATAAADVATATSTNTSAEVSPQSGQPFAWERNWWPVHVVDYLDPSRPTPVELLGQQLVLWRDAAGAWRCFRDSCPHRRVPLSEGRVEGGELVCSYHGWRFNEEGACTAIPQAPDAKSLAAATSSPRSCVVSFPTQEAGGLLWVWPEQSAAAAANASAAPPPLPNAFQHPQYRKQLVQQWFMRELPYDYDILVENFTDPSHLPYAHHGIARNLDRKAAPPTPFTSIEDRLQPDDLDLLPSGTPPLCAFHYPSLRSPQDRVVVFPPSVINYHPTGTGLVTVLLVVPTGPGRSKAFTTSAFPSKASASPLAKLARMVAPVVMPRWRVHTFMQKIFDGDSVFLHAQGHFLRAVEGQAASDNPAWAQEYFMPITSDRAVVAARKWIDSVGGGGPVYPATAAPATQQVTREQLLDRHEQHTKHCRHCRSGLEFAGRLAAAGNVLLAAAFFLLCCLAGTHGFKALLSGGLPSVGAAAAVVCGLAASWLRSMGEQLQKGFTFADYVHADIP